MVVVGSGGVEEEHVLVVRVLDEGDEGVVAVHGGAKEEAAGVLIEGRTGLKVKVTGGEVEATQVL